MDIRIQRPRYRQNPNSEQWTRSQTCHYWADSERLNLETRAQRKTERGEKLSFFGFTLSSVLEKLSSFFFFFFFFLFFSYFFVSMCENWESSEAQSLYLHLTCALNGKEQINGKNKKKRTSLFGVCCLQGESWDSLWRWYNVLFQPSLGFWPKNKYLLIFEYVVNAGLFTVKWHRSYHFI